MKAITKYQAGDGAEFNTEQECAKHEMLIVGVANIMSVLSSKHDGCDFANGSGFIQHDKDVLREIQVELLELMKKHINHEWIQQTIDDETIHPSYVSRQIVDANKLQSPEDHQF